MLVLLVLLVVAYIGSHWGMLQGTRAFGSASGVEYVVLGGLLGPHALGLLGGDELRMFQPVAFVTLGWIALGYGVECGMVGAQRAPWSRLLLSSLCTSVVAASAGGGAWWMATKLGLDARRALLLAVATGLVSAETSRQVVRWVSELRSASGPLSKLLLELAASDDIVVFVVLAWLVAAFGPATYTASPQMVVLAAAGSVVLGLVLGATAAWLIAHMPSTTERWTILLGTAFLVTGMMNGFSLSEMAAGFAAGVALNVASPRAASVREELRRTEGAVLLPALLLAGASLSPQLSPDEWIIVGVALAARVLASLLIGSAIAALRAKPRPGPFALGLGLLSSGTLTMVVAFSLHLSFGEPLGRIVLAVAFLGTVLGELVGPSAMSRALLRAGELGVEPRASQPDPEPTP